MLSGSKASIYRTSCCSVGNLPKDLSSILCRYGAAAVSSMPDGVSASDRWRGFSTAGVFGVNLLQTEQLLLQLTTLIKESLDKRHGKH